jgi:hypothetical protein
MRHPLSAVHGDDSGVCHLNVGSHKWGILEDTPTPKIAYRPGSMTFYEIICTPRGLEALPLAHEAMSVELLSDWLAEAVRCNSEEAARAFIDTHFPGVDPAVRDEAAHDYAIKADATMLPPPITIPVVADPVTEVEDAVAEIETHAAPTEEAE